MSKPSKLVPHMTFPFAYDSPYPRSNYYLPSANGCSSFCFQTYLNLGRGENAKKCLFLHFKLRTEGGLKWFKMDSHVDFGTI